jgi:SlyX protein
MTALESRVDELEIRISHQEKIIAELNDLVTAQWTKLDMMDRQLRRMIEEQSFASSDTSDANQKPPHY